MLELQICIIKLIPNAVTDKLQMQIISLIFNRISKEVRSKQPTNISRSGSRGLGNSGITEIWGMFW